MSESILFELFNALSVAQLRAARHWVASPLHNRREEPLKLFDYLENCRKQNQKCQQKEAILFVFGHQNGTDGQLRHEMSALKGLLQDFLVWQEIEKRRDQRDWLLLHAMHKLGLEKNFQLAYREIEKKRLSDKQRSIDHHWFSFKIDYEKYEWEEGQKRGHEFPLEPLQNALDTWYAGQKLQLACMEQSRQTARRKERFEMPTSLNDILELLPNQPHKSVPIVSIYYLGQKMLAEPSRVEYMESYLETLQEQVESVPPNEARDLLMLAINHGIRQINAGDRSAIRRTLDFYRLGLDKKLIHDEQGRLTKYTYNNVLMTFLALEEWDQALAFLERYKPELPALERENIFRYNLAIYYFRQGAFDAALELLRDVTFPDPMYKLEARKMLLKIYFEQEATEALESLLENLLLWLRRHGEIGYHRDMYRNLAMFTGRLLRLAPGDKEARKRLRKKVLETPLVAERQWLLGKIGE